MGVLQTKYEVMGITKAAIGLAYYIAVPPSQLNRPLWPGSRVTFRDALVRTSLHGDDGWDYHDFRAHRRTRNFARWCIARLLDAPENGQGPTHNNLLWHVLSAKLPSVAGGLTAQQILQPFLGSLDWDKDADGVPLGPCGLRLTTSQALLLATVAHQSFQASLFTRHGTQTVSPAVYTAYGWYSDGTRLWAHGFLYQYVAYSEKPAVQLRARVPLKEEYFVLSLVTQEEEMFIRSI